MDKTEKKSIARALDSALLGIQPHPSVAILSLI
jgi:hypothetical protein